MINEVLINSNIILAIIASVTVVLGVYNLSVNWILAKQHIHAPNIRIGNGQVIGDRQKQEDSFATDIQNHGLFAIVADGIGSFVDGKYSSELAVEAFLREFRKTDITDNIGYYFQRTAKAVNSQIKDIYDDIPTGTTIVSAVIRYNKLYYAWAGDSTIAVYRNGRLIPLNSKDNVGNRLEEMYQEGRISRKKVIKMPHQNRLVNYLGYDEFEQVSIPRQPVILQKEDKVLLYTDGLEVLSQVEIEDILNANQSAEIAAESLMVAVEQKKIKNKDNATVLVLSIDKEYKE